MQELDQLPQRWFHKQKYNGRSVIGGFLGITGYMLTSSGFPLLALSVDRAYASTYQFQE